MSTIVDYYVWAGSLHFIALRCSEKSDPTVSCQQTISEVTSQHSPAAGSKWPYSGCFYWEDPGDRTGSKHTTRAQCMPKRGPVRQAHSSPALAATRGDAHSENTEPEEFPPPIRRTCDRARAKDTSAHGAKDPGIKGQCVHARQHKLDEEHADTWGTASFLWIQSTNNPRLETQTNDEHGRILQEHLQVGSVRYSLRPQSKCSKTATNLAERNCL
ncbi:hypothetical protein CONLIGDRAFT_649757 [Coniochaeta ligniaria NRRL 30616]|uniref:Uncharacterized protein n=1 Tax=Coniochaeta ligniaria NRRL 30616 TaxID=1408157 RepID=A0A1J7IQ36_9PEZI|nr:hypothetical protein CONLIGDRAFT_649757 [Coniochaeta ligniaria NRRL 30616]